MCDVRALVLDIDFDSIMPIFLDPGERGGGRLSSLAFRALSSEGSHSRQNEASSISLGLVLSPFVAGTLSVSACVRCSSHLKICAYNDASGCRRTARRRCGRLPWSLLCHPIKKKKSTTPRHSLTIYDMYINNE